MKTSKSVAIVMHAHIMHGFHIIYIYKQDNIKRFSCCNTTTETCLQPGRLLKNEVILSQPNVLMHTPDVLYSYFLQPFDLWSGNINQ